MPKVFPEPPSNFIEIEKISSSKMWTVPEDGYFKIIGVAASGNGGKYVTKSLGAGTPLYYNGGSGGTGSIVASVYPLNKGDVLEIKIDGNIQIVKSGEELAKATKGSNGKSGIHESRPGENDYYGYGDGGSGGNASGGNVANINGKKGNRGSGGFGGGGSSVSISYEGFSTASGRGATNSGSTPGSGSSAYAVIFRGNTNLTSSRQNTLNITSLMLEINKVGQEITDLKLNKSV